MNSQTQAPDAETFDYIVVGSGAGGAPVAARLAEHGFRVLVIEAGSDPAGSAREVSDVPALHATSTEHPDLSWEFFVKHYSTPPCGPDSKATSEGILYPRAAALGGCTIHNSTITIAGPDADWDNLADFVDDDSWCSQVMRTYFQKLEKNEYLDQPGSPPESLPKRFWDNVRWLFGCDPDYTGGRHGFKGWLHTSWPDISLGLEDVQLIDMLKAALKEVDSEGIERFGAEAKHFLHGQGREILDPNHALRQTENPAGVALIPLAVCGPGNDLKADAKGDAIQRGRRSSPRTMLLAAKEKFGDRLTIWTECFVTRVLFDNTNKGQPPHAIGVEYFKGGKLYEAHPLPRSKPQATGKVLATREVILSGGVFNTPQLLMLSGIGEKQKLNELGIECLVDLPGVGRNLQDRYEITVLSEMEADFNLLGKSTFKLPVPPAEPDPTLQEWTAEGKGLYTSNGAVLGILKRSRPDLAQPDLFIFGMPLPFKGYEPGYSDIEKKYGANYRRFFTWAILKAHTRNRDGRVTLKSADPLQRPEINFHYFHETSLPTPEQENDPDLEALVDGVKFVRRISGHADFVKGESYPGEAVKDDKDIKDWIRRDAWGHHGCGTCRMGPPEDRDAVLDSRFRVRGVSGLRVVDASIFPKIPGYFIAANIYIASEKAADVIREDAKHGGPDSTVYPRALHQRELAAVKMRRSHVGVPTAFPKDKAPQPVADSKKWAGDVTGIALSGGGIRSATFNLGILQALAKKNLLRRIDFLSTVSGGGYIGSFLGAFFNRLRRCSHLGSDVPETKAPDAVERELTSPDSPEIAWLRRHGNYIASNGSGDSLYNLAIFIRNLIAVHFVSGILIFSVFSLVNALRYSIFDPASASINLVWAMQGFANLPPDSIGRVIQVFWSPWFVACELLLLFLVVPRIIAYWLVSPDRTERFHGPSLTVLFAFVVPLFYLSICDGLRPTLLLVVLSLLSSFIHVGLSWRRGRQREAATGTGGMETSRMRARNYLTYDLGAALAICGGALAFALIDTIAHFLHQYLLAKNPSYVAAFLKCTAVVTACIPIVRGLAGLFKEDKASGTPSTMARLFKSELSAGVLAVSLFTVPLIFYSFASHAAYGAGQTFELGFVITLFGLAISFILAQRAAIPFVNQSSLAETYASRLARAYLGASNPLRHHPAGADINEVMASDDVGSMRDYRPHESGGPFHIINVTVNQTVDFNSQRGNRDRKGESLAVSCLGLSVGTKWHGLWHAKDPETAKAQRRHLKWFSRSTAAFVEHFIGIDPVGCPPGTAHPLVDETGRPAAAAEMLSLRRWIGISGAAISPGRGSETSMGKALLFGLANLRTGYWWDSSINDSARDGFPKLTFSRRLLYLVPRIFVTQSLLIFEFIARYAGPWGRFWYLSDGGFFENLAAYELIRRRIPRIIVSDAGADPDYQFEDFANLVRKARIDFNARIEPFTKEEMTDTQIPAAVQQWLGTLDELSPSKNDGKDAGLSAKHAALFWVRYDDDPGAKSILLYIKATVTSDMTADIANYHKTHPEFPHESTGDQFFDEAQWESYRKLGYDAASQLFSDREWFQKISL